MKIIQIETIYHSRKVGNERKPHFRDENIKTVETI